MSITKKYHYMINLILYMSKVKTLVCTCIIPKFYLSEFGTKENIFHKNIFQENKLVSHL